MSNIKYFLSFKDSINNKQYFIRISLLFFLSFFVLFGLASSSCFLFLGIWYHTECRSIVSLLSFLLFLLFLIFVIIIYFLLKIRRARDFYKKPILFVMLHFLFMMIIALLATQIYKIPQTLTVLFFITEIPYLFIKTKK
jgi:uncharacterized membrane protein YhaH (DUF805 family)